MLSFLATFGCGVVLGAYGSKPFIRAKDAVVKLAKKANDYLDKE